jgi:hypothetical protein
LSSISSRRTYYLPRHLTSGGRLSTSRFSVDSTLLLYSVTRVSAGARMAEMRRTLQALVERDIRDLSHALERTRLREQRRKASSFEVEGTKLARVQRLHELATNIRLKTLVDTEVYRQVCSRVQL